MSKIGKYFSSTHPAVKKLLIWKQSDIDHKWATKAIDTLVKKLKKRKNSLENLEYALSNQNCPSVCVIMTKNSDGRLQVMHRKELPHVIYCRIWRWPDLVSHHELMSTDTCEHPFSTKNSEICVNPYHYRRLDSPTLPPVLVPHQSKHQTVQCNQLPMQLQQPLEPRLPCNVSYGSDGFSISTNYNNSNNNAKCNYRNDISNIQVYNNELMNYNTQPVSTNIEFSNYNNQIGNYMTECAKNDNEAGNINYGNEYNNLSNINNGYFRNENENCNTEENFYNVEPKHYNATSLGQLDNSNATPQNGMPLMDLQNVNNFPESLSQVHSSNNCYDYGNVIQTDLPSMQMNNCSNTFPFTPVNYSEPKYWASIAYYELNNRVGEIYQCELTSIIVDGFTNPHGNSNRFCLGKLSNVKRNASIENTRRHIGKGLGLHYLNGELIAECLSDSAIFTQSRNCNHFNNFQSNTVCKIQPGYNLKIFSNEYFAQLLRQSVHYGFDAVYELTKMCTIRMSFVKGWGAEYQRQDVTTTPCWIEIHLNGPLQWLDQVLNQMGPSIHRISSVS